MTQQAKESPGWQAAYDPESVRSDHPAYGMIGASRVSAHPGSPLFGSDFLHRNHVVIRIYEAELNRDLSRDWPHARRELIEVSLSEAQWATFVSSMNCGDGVPCTLDHVAGVARPTLPHRRTEDVAKKELDDVLKRAAGRVKQTLASIEGELGAGLSAKKREAILEHLVQLERAMSDHLPFAAKSFAEHMETVVEKAKVEVNAYVQNMVTRTGLDALSGRTAPLLALTAGKGDDHGEKA